MELCTINWEIFTYRIWKKEESGMMALEKAKFHTTWVRMLYAMLQPQTH